jgi:sec-independent protein translocase protein TatA
MGSMSLVHWLLVAAVALLLFGGRGKLSSLMKDAAEGIKGFRKGLADEPPAQPASGTPVVDDGKTIEASVSKSKTEA